MRIHSATTPFPAGALVALALVAPFAFAGGMERDCRTAGEPIERWPSGPGHFRWAVRVDASNVVVPGFPPVGCIPGTPRDEEPGVQSLARAMRAWTTSGASIPFDDVPDTIATGGFNWTGSDSVNMATFHEPTLNGGMWGGVLAVTRVQLDPATNLIREADIAFNPGPSWIEERDWTSIALRSSTAARAVDIQGVATHEIGHLLGLGHSLVDSSFSLLDSRCPTLHPFAQQTRRRLEFLPVQGCPPPGGQTPVQVLEEVEGFSARTLELDDLNAIHEGYPGNNAAFGAIVGRVQGSGGAGRTGMHVTARRSDVLDANPVSVLTYDDGRFEIDRLPPGDYVVYVEVADGTPPPKPVACGLPLVQTQAYYFAQEILPTYLTSFWPANCVLNTCVSGSNSRFEHYTGVAESGFEGDAEQSTAQVVTVVAGIRFAITIVVEGSPGFTQTLTGWDKDAFGAGVNIRHSPRGVRNATSGFGPPEVRFRARASTGSTIELRFSANRFARLDMAQVTPTTPYPHVEEVVQGTLNGLPLLTQTVPPGSSFVEFDVPIPDAHVDRNVFVQAKVIAPGGVSYFYSNVMNVWRFQ